MTIHTRRRSAAIGLTALSLTAGLAACGEKATETPMKVYASADACQQAGQDWNTCQTSFQQAAAEHEKAAPHYNSREECLRETQGDDCNERVGSGGQHFFMPLMAGFMLGHMMSGNRGYVSHPVYYGQGGGLYSGGAPLNPRNDNRQPGGGSGSTGGGFGARRTLPTEVSAPLSAKGAISSRAVSRGGFGRAFSSHGGAGE